MSYYDDYDFYDGAYLSHHDRKKILGLSIGLGIGLPVLLGTLLALLYCCVKRRAKKRAREIQTQDPVVRPAESQHPMRAFGQHWSTFGRNDRPVVVDEQGLQTHEPVENSSPAGNPTIAGPPPAAAPAAAPAYPAATLS